MQSDQPMQMRHCQIKHEQALQVAKTQQTKAQRRTRKMCAG
jgi:hypothetical protein